MGIIKENGEKVEEIQQETLFDIKKDQFADKKATGKKDKKPVKNQQDKGAEVKKTSAKDSKEEKSSKVTFDIAVKEGQKLLTSCYSCIEAIYNKYFRIAAFGYVLEEVKDNFESYLQSLLFLGAISDGKQSHSGIEFLYNLLKRADIFSKKGNIEDVIQGAKKACSKMPVAIMMTVAVDKKHGEKNSRLLCDEIYSIYKIMCTTDNKTPLKREKFIKDIISFAQEQGVII